jgi:hypothetical protein
MKMVEARKRNDPPDKNHKDDKRTLVLAGELYQVEVGVTTTEAGGQHIFLSAALDTCSESNLIRTNQLPYGSEVITLSNPPVVTAAQGNPVKVSGVATLRLQLPGHAAWIMTDFLVVDSLIVPAVLGTPWIDRYVLTIFPKKKTVLVQIHEEKAPVEVNFQTRVTSCTAVIRAVSQCAIPAFPRPGSPYAVEVKDSRWCTHDQRGVWNPCRRTVRLSGL